MNDSGDANGKPASLTPAWNTKNATLIWREAVEFGGAMPSEKFMSRANKIRYALQAEGFWAGLPAPPSVLSLCPRQHTDGIQFLNR